MGHRAKLEKSAPQDAANERLLTAQADILKALENIMTVASGIKGPEASRIWRIACLAITLGWGR